MSKNQLMVVSNDEEDYRLDVDELKKATSDSGLKKADLAREFGISEQAVGKWFKLGKISITYLVKLAKLLGVTTDRLLGISGVREDAQHYNTSPSPTGDRIPLISSVQAGVWTESPDEFEPGNAEDWLYCPKSHGPRAYALKVDGDSMTSPYPGQRSYPHGMIIFVDPDASPDPGSRVIAKLTDTNEVTFKELVVDAGKRYLKPLNPQYDKLEINGNCQIIGKVIGGYIPE